MQVQTMLYGTSPMTTFRPVSTGFPAMMLMLSAAAFSVFADQQVISDDGREVLLRQDGTWEFLSGDRFANTDGGQRVRLKQDGSWEYVGNAPMVAPTRVRTKELEISLQHTVIETHEVKVQKNTRVNSQTVFHVELASSPINRKEISVDEQDMAHIGVTDSKGRKYRVLSLQPATETLKPGSQMNVAIRVDGSPQWWKNVKSMTVELRPGLFGLKEPVRLYQDVDEVEKKKVDGFEQ
jgi:hypothetical protein